MPTPKTQANVLKSPAGIRSKSARLLIVDDHPIVREGLASLLASEADLEICGQAGTIPEALSIAEAVRPDLAIVDLGLEKGSGLELIRRFAACQPPVPAIVCSLYDESLYAERALRAGARGYVNKSQATQTIVRAIRRVLEGGIYLSDRMSERLARRLAGDTESLTRPLVSQLSDRELEVFQLIGNGFTTAEIAKSLHLGIKTIETLRRRIKTKLNLTNAAQLARDATAWVVENG